MNCDALFQQLTNAGCNFAWQWPWAHVVILLVIGLTFLLCGLAYVVHLVRERRRINENIDMLLGVGLQGARRRGWLPEDLQ